ncbi:Serine/threonine-protein kinase NIM1 [Pseudolycoriella hygida]|uniref:Serine/threonine-protein kinase NIM1 n=1 Tax=Pseudolycoriella hygida TaxID=35572 RepID=A0A9Q0SA77_9DIPT|nr:Serine/threonine-protein kinase NIM1 [Pseudolycoriella hygida]
MADRKVALGRRVGLYRFCGDIGRGNFSRVKLAIHQLTRGTLFHIELQNQVLLRIYLRQLMFSIIVNIFLLILPISCANVIIYNLDISIDKVAIKVVDRGRLDARALRMLSREVTTLECVHHPNILRLFEVVETLGRVHLVTEWIRGGELYNRITQGGPLTEAHAAPLYKQLLSAVKHMHSLGFVHRDIKAENVLMVTEDRIKLADFGFSTQLINGSQQHLDTFCGSPPYAAPELFSDDHYIGGPVDVWALGVLVYFMIVGNMPFRAPTVPALRTAVLSGDFCLPSHLSLPCIRLIQRILVHTPSRRPTIDQLLMSQWVNHNHLLIELAQSKQQKNSWFPRRRKFTRERHIEMSNLAPIQCSTKRASSIYAENFLNPIDMPNIEELTISQPVVTKSHRKSIFSGTLKKKIGPMEDGGEKGNMFNRKQSTEIKMIENDLTNGVNSLENGYQTNEQRNTQ